MLWTWRLLFWVSSSGFWLHSPATIKSLPWTILTSWRTDFSEPSTLCPSDQLEVAGRGGFLHFGKATHCLYRAEDSALLEAHWLMFPELIKTFMASRPLMQKNRFFIIDYSAKIIIKIRITSQGFVTAEANFAICILVTLKKTQMSQFNSDCSFSVKSLLAFLFWYFTRFLESREYLNWNV